MADNFMKIPDPACPAGKQVRNDGLVVLSALQHQITQITGKAFS